MPIQCIQQCQCYQERQSNGLAATPQGGSKEIYDVMAARYRSLEGRVVSDKTAL